jgi:hypothetical protein
MAGSVFAQEPQEPGSDEEIRTLISDAGASKDNDGADSVIVFDRTLVDVEESGLSHITIHNLTKVLTEKGASKLARLRFDYDPTSNIVEVREIRIFRKSGTIETVPLNDLLDLPQPQDWILWGPRMKIVPIPRLNPEDSVEYKIYKKGFMIAYLGEDEERYIPPMRGHFYDSVMFEERVPIKLRHYTVTTPRSKPVQFEVYNGELKSCVTFTEDKNIYSFWKENVKAFTSEPHAPADSDLATKVVLATVPDWPAKSRWFYDVNEKARVFDSDDAIRAKVLELTQNLETDEEKVAALVHWSAQEIRYSGITMGKGEGYTIHPGTMTFHDRAGVCKDKAGMAITMLRAAGYAVYPAMTMAGSRVERIPADQFNHCVVALKKKDGSFRMLDPTWVVFSPELWSSAESEQNYVIGTETGEGLSETPLSPAENNAISIVSDALLDKDGTLTGTIVVTGSGYQDQRLRRLLVHATTAPDRRSVFEQWVANIAPQAELLSFTNNYNAILDFSKPIRYELTYRIKDYAVPAGTLMQLEGPAAHNFIDNPVISPYLESIGLEKRTDPLFLWCTRLLRIQERLKLPEGYTVTHVPDDKKLDGKAASLQTRWSRQENTLEFNEELSFKLRTVPAKDYPNFKEVVEAVQKLAKDPIVLSSETKN